jgi:ketosteroid isomerase-like protein
MDDAHSVVERYWAAGEARDWDTFVGLVAEDVVYEAPATRERVRGREAYRRFNAEGFPGDWHASVQRIVAEGNHAASWIEFTLGGQSEAGLCFFDFGDDGLITRITDFWPMQYDPPANRIHLIERY